MPKYFTPLIAVFGVLGLMVLEASLGLVTLSETAARIYGCSMLVLVVALVIRAAYLHDEEERERRVSLAPKVKIIVEAYLNTHDVITEEVWESLCKGEADPLMKRHLLHEFNLLAGSHPLILGHAGVLWVKGPSNGCITQATLTEYLSALQN